MKAIVMDGDLSSHIRHVARRGSMTRHVLIPALALLASVVTVSAQGAPDSVAVRRAAVDYIEGWYAGDAVRMERALHPELAKRIVRTDSTSSESRLSQMSALSLVQGTRYGGGNRTPREKQQKDVQILDIYRGSSSVKIVASDWIDYLHLAKWNGRWVIVNVLWELKPPAGER
ncbi:MAG: nuclear transport factor 2 family protein [Anaerolineae bacterium]|nr:nuclear transport factor 2 family protein [Gemmatimonadaceae bacterium]